MTDDQLMLIKVGAVGMVPGMLIGSFFGPAGFIAGAVISGAIFAAIKFFTK